MKLAAACELGDEALADSLLAAHPDAVRSLTPDDTRRLADAAQRGNRTAVRLLLKAGWPVDARGQHGATALHWAGFHGDAEMTREILAHRPPLEARSTEFEGTPLEWTLYGSSQDAARGAEYAAALEALLEAGAAIPADPGSASDAVREALRRYNRGGR